VCSELYKLFKKKCAKPPLVFNALTAEETSRKRTCLRRPSQCALQRTKWLPLSLHDLLCVFSPQSAGSSALRTKIQRRRCTTSERRRNLPPRNEARGGLNDAPLVRRLDPDRAHPHAKNLRRGSVISLSFRASKLGFSSTRTAGCRILTS
jgi:hypothetical protein